MTNVVFHGAARLHGSGRKRALRFPQALGAAAGLWLLAAAPPCAAGAGAPRARGGAREGALAADLGRPPALNASVATALRGSSAPALARLPESNASGRVQGACAATADILFLVDMSNTVGTGGAAAAQMFIASILNTMTLGVGVGQQVVGLVEAGDGATVLSPLTSDGTALVAAAQKLKPSGQSCVNLAAALSTVQHVLMNGRVTAMRKVFVVVDGPACSQTLAVQQAQQVGMYAELLVMVVVENYVDYNTMPYAKQWLEATSIGGPPRARLMGCSSFDEMAKPYNVLKVGSKLCSPPLPSYPAR